MTDADDTSANAPSPGTADPLGLHGVVAPTVTAFSADESVDYKRTADHAGFVADRGAHAVYPLGTVGEFPLLTHEERRGVVEAVVEAVDVPVVAGVGAPGTEEAVRYADHARAAGADAVVATTPSYYPVDDEGVATHYRRLAAAVDRPVYVAHAPANTGNAFTLDTVERLTDLDGVVGIADASEDVPFLGQAIDQHADLTFLVGSDALLFPGLEIGCSGAVSAVASAFPELVRDLYDAYDGGEEGRARDLQSQIYEVRTALQAGPHMAGVKAALDLRGFDAGPLRDPLRRMDGGAEARLGEKLADMGLL
ncbi:MAG: dihydrodipicolinate synthase family protein [Halobacteriaceae archaeon]